MNGNGTARAVSERKNIVAYAHWTTAPHMNADVYRVLYGPGPFRVVFPEIGLMGRTKWVTVEILARGRCWPLTMQARYFIISRKSA